MTMRPLEALHGAIRAATRVPTGWDAMAPTVGGSCRSALKIEHSRAAHIEQTAGSG